VSQRLFLIHFLVNGLLSQCFLFFLVLMFYSHDSDAGSSSSKQSKLSRNSSKASNASRNSSSNSSTGLTDNMAAMGGDAMDNLCGQLKESNTLLQAAEAELQLCNDFISSKGLDDEFSSYKKECRE